MHSSESEGEGIGRCVGVLVGNRSGGHKAPVLHVVSKHNHIPLNSSSQAFLGMASYVGFNSDLWRKYTVMSSALRKELNDLAQMDRCVKIWRVPYVDYEKVRNNEEQLAREDKPLFSTDLIHKSRVLAIAWWAPPHEISRTRLTDRIRLNDDILVSCSAPALMRGDSIDDMYEEPGEIVVWQWLGFDRFLKQGQVQRIMRGCVSVRAVIHRLHPISV